jgi:hypothetical protein
MLVRKKPRKEKSEHAQQGEKPYLYWPNGDSIGKAADGSIVVKDEEGLCVFAMEGCEWLSDHVLEGIAQLACAEDTTKNTEAMFWQQSLASVNQGKPLPVEVMTVSPAPLNRSEHSAPLNSAQINGAHKRKGVKVEPIDDSGQPSRNIEGRLDWKERASATQVPNANSESAPFRQYFEPRYAPFPRGTRMTPERISEMKISRDLLPKERDMLLEVLYRREGALAWDFRESGRVSKDVIPPVIIDTVPHQAWRADQFPVPRKLRQVVIDMIQDRINRGTLELCKSQYRNPWFLVAKKDKGYRLINNAQKLNGVTIRDANPPPNPDEFSEEFAGCAVMSLLDFFSGYDQVELHKDSRDMTAFSTPLGLVRQCTLPMGTTNSVAEFVRVMTKICREHIPDRCMPYLDDVCIKGPKTKYTNKEIEPGIRQFIAEHLSNIDKVLADIERAGATISGHKSDFCYPSMIVVGYRIDQHGRHPDEKKIDKIINWPDCRNAREVRMFIGVCVYYRIWVLGFAIIAAPLFKLLRKNAPFEWTYVEKQAMEHLKRTLTSAPALVSIDYTEPIRKIILAVDGSKKGWGAVIMQLDLNGHRHPIRFESGVWSTTERNWDSSKHECKALLLALKKFRSYIYGVRFEVETDAKTLIAQLQRSATDLPGALITRWLALLNMWDFDIVHVAGKKNVVADALSRRPEPEGWEPPEEPEEDVEDFIDAHLNAIQLLINDAPALEYGMCRADLSFEDEPLEGGYSEESQAIAVWILFRRRPEGLSTAELRKFKKKALRMTVRERHLFTIPSGGRPLRRVVDNPVQQLEIVRALHDESGHRGKEGTWRKVWARYHWKGQYEQVKKYVQSCPECQSHASATVQEELWPTEPPNLLFGWITIDVVYMPPSRNGKKFLIVARDYVSQWVEAKALVKNDSKSVQKFLLHDVFCRWGIPLKMSADGGPENKGLVEDLQGQWGINRVTSSAYHPQGQGLIERGHAPIVAALKKLPGNWVDNLTNVLWADRTTIKRSTNETPAYLVSGQQHILPIELSIPTWQTLPWTEVYDTPTLLAMRARQFDRRDERFRESIDRTIRLRHENKEYFDNSKVLRPTKLSKGDLVLLRDSFYDNDRSTLTKFLPKWKGPFRISSVNEKGWYRLEELDGTTFRSHTPGNRLKAFHQRTIADLEEIDSQLYPQEVRPQNRGQSGIDEASDSSEEDATDTPGYGQDIPQTEKQNMKKARRSPRTQQLKDNTPIDLDEEQDISRTEAKPKRLVAVVPRRRPGFNPNDYQMCSSRYEE